MAANQSSNEVTAVPKRIQFCNEAPVDMMLLIVAKVARECGPK